MFSANLLIWARNRDYRETPLDMILVSEPTKDFKISVSKLNTAV